MVAWTVARTAERLALRWAVWMAERRVASTVAMSVDCWAGTRVARLVEHLEQTKVVHLVAWWAVH